MTTPKFIRDEMVRYAGAVGRIKNYQSNSNTRSYAVEMQMGPAPDFGRVGSETTVFVDEADLQKY
jgi:hypothetical protein